MRALRVTPSGVVLDPRAPGFSGSGTGELPPGEALIRPTRLAITRSDVLLAERRGNAGMGNLATPGSFTLGRDFVGIVEKVNVPAGAVVFVDPKKLIGKRVVGSIDAVCGKCDLCQRGLSLHCRQRTTLGTQQRDGCFADLFRLPIANLHMVPDSLDDDRAVFSRAVAAAVHVARQVRIEGRPYITVLGDGPLGLLCAQVLARLNASVRVLGHHEHKLELCAKWGVKHRPAGDAGRREDQDVVIDCTGVASGLELAMQLVRPRGKILLKSDLERQPLDISPVVENEIELIGSRAGSMPDALTAMQREQVDVVSLIGRRFKLDQGVEAMKAAAQQGMLRVLLDV